MVMNRAQHIDYITKKLSILATEIELRGKLNLLDLHLHAENFYSHFFNELFGWDLSNLNVVDPNATAIDLIDDKNKIVVQVSSTATKSKIETALGKDLSKYSTYSFSKGVGSLLDSY